MFIIVILVYCFTLFGTYVRNHAMVAFCASFPHENGGKAGMGAYPQASPPSQPSPVAGGKESTGE